jgi:hypothetical protein
MCAHRLWFRYVVVTLGPSVGEGRLLMQAVDARKFGLETPLGPQSAATGVCSLVPDGGTVKSDPAASSELSYILLKRAFLGTEAGGSEVCVYVGAVR